MDQNRRVDMILCLHVIFPQGYGTHAQKIWELSGYITPRTHYIHFSNHHIYRGFPAFLSPSNCLKTAKLHCLVFSYKPMYAPPDPTTNPQSLLSLYPPTKELPKHSKALRRLLRHYDEISCLAT